MYRLIISMPDEMKLILKEESEKRGQTMAGFIRTILYDYIKRKEK